MADSAVWGEAIARAMGYKENDFLSAYLNNIKFQNAEVIDSNPVAFAIKKLVEKLDLEIESNNITLFEGSPLELLKILNEIATENNINTYSNEWPKDHKWIIRRINTIKSNLQQELGIDIEIKRNSSNNSIIKMVKNNSGISGEYNLSPANESLSPYLRVYLRVQRSYLRKKHRI